jgi:polyhydroxybutyrate depolymerase
MQAARSVRFACVISVLLLVVAACSGGSAKPTSSAATSTAGLATTTTAIAPSRVAAAASDGCRAPAVNSGQTRVDLTSGGVARWYLRHLPPGYSSSKPMPVVIDLHGYSEGATIQTVASNLGGFGDGHGFLTITPEGSGSGRFVTWDTALDSTDVRFVGDLLDQIERTLCVDTRRVFFTGYSQGAFMTSTLACAYADRIAAVATIAGIRDAPGCRPSQPVPVVAFHGTDDRHIAYSGGLGPDGLKLPAYDGSGKTMGEEGLQLRPPLNGAAIPVIAGAWAKRNGCSGPPDEHDVAADVTVITWPCPPSRAVQLYRIKGGGHTWPGSAFTTAAASILGPTTHSISADAVIWRFFQTHPLRDP